MDTHLFNTTIPQRKLHLTTTLSLVTEASLASGECHLSVPCTELDSTQGTRRQHRLILQFTLLLTNLTKSTIDLTLVQPCRSRIDRCEGVAECGGSLSRCIRLHTPFISQSFSSRFCLRLKTATDPSLGKPETGVVESSDPPRRIRLCKGSCQVTRIQLGVLL